MTGSKHRQRALQRLAQQIERGIRNQAVIDRMKQPPKETSMLKARDHYQVLIGALLIACALFFLLVAAGLVHADELKAPQCPDPGVKCKILYLNEQEEQYLVTKNGVLDTAAQARSLDLGQFVVYLKQKIATAPAGTVTPPEGKKDESKPLLDLTPKDVKPN